MLVLPRIVISPRAYSPVGVQNAATSLASPRARALRNSWAQARTAALSAERSGSLSPPPLGDWAGPRSSVAPTAAHRVEYHASMGHLANRGSSGYGHVDAWLTPCRHGE